MTFLAKGVRSHSSLVNAQNPLMSVWLCVCDVCVCVMCAELAAIEPNELGGVAAMAESKRMV